MLYYKHRGLIIGLYQKFGRHGNVSCNRGFVLSGLDHTSLEMYVGGFLQPGSMLTLRPTTSPHHWKNVHLDKNLCLICNRVNEGRHTLHPTRFT